ncbi:MAG: ATP-binding cassette domain-containing protein [Methylovirgula sp.]|uniref:ABC transporter ATP-binding protein n=1 Tax=Methylovirgula sp. TaxID=1978224 RepID=UPI003075F9F4
MTKLRGTIRLDNVSHRYPRRPLTLDRLTLRIGSGERVALLGRSGCGKSTLLQIVSGLLQPTNGEVQIDGTPVSGPSPRWNLMFQKPLLLPWLDVAGNVALGLRFAGRSKEAPARVAQMLDIVGLHGYGARPVTELSGGQQQRVALARSLATDPEILLLDEPYASLDAVTRAALRAEVRAIAGELGLTLLLVTHDVDDALDLAERIIVMAPNPGRLIADVILASTPAGGLRTHLLGLLENDRETAGETLSVPVLQ